MNMQQLPPPGPRRNAMLVAVAASAVSAVLAWRDLKRRPQSAVRGNKRLWRAAILLNTGNSFAYWLFGRKRS